MTVFHLGIRCWKGNSPIPLGYCKKDISSQLLLSVTYLLHMLTFLSLSTFLCMPLQLITQLNSRDSIVTDHKASTQLFSILFFFCKWTRLYLQQRLETKIWLLYKTLSTYFQIMKLHQKYANVTAAVSLTSTHFQCCLRNTQYT